MKTIHQYQLASDKQITSLALRDGFRIVRCEYVVAQKRVYLWVEEPLKIDLPVSEHQFMVVGSGVPVPVSYRYVDTALDPFGPEAFHVYELAESVGAQAEKQTGQHAPLPQSALRLSA